MYKLINVNCFDYFKTISDKSFSHLITDPPYSERTHKGARSGTRSNHNLGEKVLINFDHINEEQFYLFCQEAIRITKRWIIFTCDLYYAGKLQDHEILSKYLIRVGVWIKPNASPQFSGDRPGQGWEAVVIMHPKGKKRWNNGGHHAVWTCNIVQGAHPTQKPVMLYKEWISQFTDPGESIIDPFMGVGSSGVAALEMNRNFIGVELNKKWFVLAEHRIKNIDSQLKLFVS